MRARKRSIIAVGLGIFLVISMMGMITTAEATDGIIYVPAPTGIPEKDWYNIQSALDSAMPGDTIVFAAGSYYVHRPLIKDGFLGTLRGAGIDSTEIVASKSSDGALIPAFYYPDWDDWIEGGGIPNAGIYLTSLFCFSNCEGVAFTDLTLRMDTPEIAERSYAFDLDTGEFLDYIPDWYNDLAFGVLVGAEADCSTYLEHFRMIGSNDGYQFQPVSPNHGFYIEGLRSEGTGSTHIARNCEFIGMGGNAYQPTILENIQVIVEDSLFMNDYTGAMLLYCDNADVTITGCHFECMGGTGVGLWGASGHVADVSRNTMIDSAGIFVWTYPYNEYTYTPYEKCYFNFEHNEIVQRCDSEWAGVEIWNVADEYDWAELAIKSNRIHGEDTFLMGPIYTLNAHNAEITNNIITGAGIAAMYIGAASWYGAHDTGVLIQGNNVENFYVYDGFGTAQIWLGPYTSQCSVIGNPSNVFDESDDPSTPEYDGNNILIGVK
ncbi:MAG: hypothetical protein ACFFCX_17505 [Candidatus Sifarchaeia archaeon]